ncbi:hypothetical protein CN978_22680 [Priestia megaterium]|nr:hypothetical protein CN978_22680 [Priestia megaterium]
MHISILLWLIFQNIQKKTWKKIHELYAGGLYVSFFNILYYFLCNDKLLWDFKSSHLSLKGLRVLHLIFITPLMIWSFLATYPPTLVKQVKYIAKWVCTASFVEWIGLRCKAITFRHGWHLGWSALIYVMMLIFSRWFQKKPFAVLLLSVLATVVLSVIFKVPVSKRMLKHPLKRILTRPLKDYVTQAVANKVKRKCLLLKLFS